MSALIASLFAVGASPAAAVEGEADAPPTAKACVGDALDDRGFTDLGTLSATVPNINCLAYYGITIGKTADTFDPNSNVTRSEMALFLYRAANLMGVDLMGGDMMVDYGDIAELGEDRQNAITALARNGILSGRGSMAFEPGADITRAEMAVALVALLDKTPGAPVQKNSAGEYLVGPDPGKRPDDSFSDSRSSQPRHIDDAISAAYELGITTGAGDGSMFDPSGTIPRRDMATFIIRALNHSNVRPAGLSAQADGGNITVSVRDANFAPVANQAIDMFYISAADEARALKDDGTCQAGRVSQDSGSASKCEVDGGDAVTQTNGNTTIQIPNSDIGDGVTAWVWAGDIGDKYNDNTTDSVVLSISKGTQTVDARSAAISTDLAKGATRAHFGSPVNVTIQLKGMSGTETVDAGPGDAEVEYSVYMQYFAGSSVADPTFDSSTGALTTAARPINAATSTVKVGSDGSVTFPVVANDPSAQVDNFITVRYTVSRKVVTETTATVTDILVPPKPDAAGTDTITLVSVAVTPATTPPTTSHVDSYWDDIVFSDERAKVAAVTVEAPNQVAPGTETAGTAATVTVVDQYGNPFNGAAVTLTSTLATSDTPDTARFTGSNGQVRIGYRYSGGAAVETITAIWDGDTADASDDTDDTLDPGSGEGQEDDTACNDGRDNADTTDVTAGNDVCGRATVLWTGQVRDDNSGAASTVTPATSRPVPDFSTAPTVLSLDTESRQIVVANNDTSSAGAPAAGAPLTINYDAGDFFNVVNADNASPGKPVTIDEFEKALAADLKEAADTDAADQPTLGWTHYDYDDSGKITAFTMTAGGSR